jgi:uncharacterized SAM-binding protein YcdF (DUF218 family)
MLMEDLFKMRQIDDITNFIFVEDKLEQADIIFIPGSGWPELTEEAAELWKEGYAPYILPSGKYSCKKGYFQGPLAKNDVYDKSYGTEWEFMQDVAIKAGVEKQAVLKEDDSENTYENAFKSREVTDRLNLNIKKAIICCKAFHARRCLMFYSWAYPNTEFIVYPVEIQEINRDNWFSTPYGMNRVMGELMRCGAQFQEAIPVYRVTSEEKS